MFPVVTGRDILPSSNPFPSLPPLYDPQPRLIYSTSAYPSRLLYAHYSPSVPPTQNPNARPSAEPPVPRTRKCLIHSCMEIIGMHCTSSPSIQHSPAAPPLSISPLPLLDTCASPCGKCMRHAYVCALFASWVLYLHVCGPLRERTILSGFFLIPQAPSPVQVACPSIWRHSGFGNMHACIQLRRILQFLP